MQLPRAFLLAPEPKRMGRTWRIDRVVRLLVGLHQSHQHIQSVAPGRALRSAPQPLNFKQRGGVVTCVIDSFDHRSSIVLIFPNWAQGGCGRLKFTHNIRALTIGEQTK